MPDYFYDMDLVVDPLNPSNVVAMGSVAIYDPADTAGTTLLALKDPSGLPLPNPLTSNANGFLPPRIATVPQTLWKSGGFEGYFNSFKGLRDEAVSAVAAAQGAADAATTAVAEVVTTAAVDGAGSLVLTKANGSTVNAGSVRGPQGVQGAPGQNGSNVLPTEEAIAAAVNGNGAAKAALSAAIASQTAPVSTRTENIGRRLGMLLDNPPVTNRSCWPLTRSNGTATAQNSLTRHILTSDVTQARLVYVNGYSSAGNDDGVGNPITVTSAVELADGTFIPVTFNGKRPAIIESGAFVVSDPVALDLPKGTAIRARTYVKVEAGERWPLGHAGSYVGTLGDGHEMGASGTVLDKTLSGTMGSASGLYLYGPAAIIGQGADVWNKPSIGLLGDSVIWGQGDEGSSRVSQAGPGYAQRALNNQFNFISVADPGDRATNTDARGEHKLRWLMLAGVNHAISNFGVNDLSNGVPLAEYQAAIVSIWSQLKARGAKVWQCTITPVSTSTDGWLTAANQTAGSASAIKLANDWLLDGAPILNGVAVATGSNAVGTVRNGHANHPLAGVFDVTSPVVTADGKWKDAVSVRSATGIVTTAGSGTVTSPTANFTIPADRYKRIAIPGAGAAGATYYGQVAALTSATQITVSPNPGTSVSGVTGTVYDPMTVDGVHTWFAGAELMAAGIDTSKLV